MTARGLRIWINDQPCHVPAGTTVAAACALHGHGHGLRRSVQGQARSALCGMGVCGECRVHIDGQAHQLSCQRLCQEGMQVHTQAAAQVPPPAPSHRTHPPMAQQGLPWPPQLVVVGAGPAGLAAAEAAAQQGVSVLLLDAVERSGGQVWRAQQGQLPPEAAARLARLQALGVTLWTRTRVVGVLPGRRLRLDHGDAASVLSAPGLVLATGARELLLPFPGWTRPGVHGAGGLQALVKGGWPVRAQAVLVAGAGPLLLASAASLVQAGARVLEIAHETEAADLRPFAGQLLRHHPDVLLQAAALARQLWRVPQRTGWRVLQALGDGDDGPLRAVTLLHRSGRTRTVPCQALAAGWGLVPQTDLAQALGCALSHGPGPQPIRVNDQQASSVPGVWAAGECTGLAGMACALLTGTLAGLAAASALQGTPLAITPEQQHALARQRRYADLVARSFALGPATPARWDDQTLICRCEDVPWGRLKDQADLHSAKLASRCGMGHCQGRLCWSALDGLVPAAPARPARPLLGAMPLSHCLALHDDPGSSADSADAGGAPADPRPQ